MRLFLIRHGETVDNVAGLYAGVRDSKLTVHGTEQAARLGQYLAKTGVELTHIFSSPLSRAIKTAEAISAAQPRRRISEDADDVKDLEIEQVPDLIEQDFGWYEGKPFHMRADARKPGVHGHGASPKRKPGFVDVETKEAMMLRADAFLDGHLLGLYDKEAEAAVEELSVAIISHGMLLAQLWKRLLSRLPRKSLTIAPEVIAAKGNVVLEHPGGWSNTGYLELRFRKDDMPGCRLAASIPTSAQQSQTTSEREEVSSTVLQRTQSSGTTILMNNVALMPNVISGPNWDLSGWSTTILAIDSKEHLSGLKRQRGGIGRSAHDEGQKKIDGFFAKRQKLG